MVGKSCFFIGSRHAQSDIREPLKEAVEKHIIDYDVVNFYVGRYGSFDRIVQGVLREAKERHKHIHNYLIFPYAMSQKGVEVPQGFDCLVYPDGLEKTPLRLAIPQANLITLKSVDYLIAYPGVGNSRNLVEVAQKREKRKLIKVTIIEKNSL